MKQFTAKEDYTAPDTLVKATHTVTFESEAYSNAIGAQTIFIKPPTIKARYNTNSGGRNYISDTAEVYPRISGVSSTNVAMFGTPRKVKTQPNADRELESYGSAEGYADGWTVTLSDLFSESNKTIKTIPINWSYFAPAYSGFQTGTAYSDGVHLFAHKRTDTSLTINSEGSITLNAPPTFDNTDLSFSTQDAYTSITTASISVSNLSAEYGGDISQVELKIGTQTATRSTAGTLEILLGYAGTFTPTISVTDSRGQVTTKSLPALVVQEYNAPQAAFSVERANQNGAPEDEGTCALLKASFHWVSEIANLQAPTISITDPDGQSVTATVAWYKDAGLTTVLSDWSTLTAADMPVYGLIDNSSHDVFNTSYSYQIGLVPSDTIGSGAEVFQTLGLAFYTMDFLAGGHGIAFGQPARNEGFECAMQASFADKGNIMTALVDLIHPVGSYYWTSDGDFVPADVFGGSWEQIDAGVTLVSAGTGYTVNSGTAKDGGNPTATLEIANMPAHNHNEKSLTGYVTLRKTGAGYNTAVSRSGIVSSISDSGSGTSVNGSGSTGQKLDQVNFNATHTHDTQGSGTAFNIMNPYKCAYCWHRIG